MEELQDAIEDAQYINAVHEDVPKPTKEWKFLPPEKLQTYIEALKSKMPHMFTLETLCSGPLGFYMFTKFVKEKGYIVQGNFLMDVAKYRHCAVTKRAKVASKIRVDYLLDNKPNVVSSDNSGTITSIASAVPSSSSAGNNKLPSNLTRKLLPDSINTDNKSTIINEKQDTPSLINNNNGNNIQQQQQLLYQDGLYNSINWREHIQPPLPIIAKIGNVSAATTTKGTLSPSSAGSSGNNSVQLANSHSRNVSSESGVVLVPSNANSSTSVNKLQDNISASSQDVDIAMPTNSLSLVGPLFGEVLTVIEDALGLLLLTNKRNAEILEQHQQCQQSNIMNGMTALQLPTPQHVIIHLPRSLFDKLDTIIYKYLEEMLWDEFQASSYCEKYWQFMYMSERPVGEEDFSLFRVLGRGGFGLVNGCKHAPSGKLFAMKMMNKRRVKAKKSEALCLNERNILTTIDSPFIVCLKYAFTTPTDLYLIVDLMMGGDLGFHLVRKTRFNSIETKFYAVRTLMGIAALHDKDIVYRDLKPENILMDSDGYTRISDLGLASNIGRNGLSGTCGTRGYWAPEMLKKDIMNQVAPNTSANALSGNNQQQPQVGGGGHPPQQQTHARRERYFKQVDWFSYGCVVYEFVYGCSPFRTNRARNWGNFSHKTKEDRDKAIDLAILEMEPEFDPSIFTDPITIDFLSKLLNKNPLLRLGAGGTHEVMQHAWFNDIDWDQVVFTKPPWKPTKNINMASQSEIGSFTDDKDFRKVVILPEDQQQYENFAFINSKAYEEEVVEFLRYEETGKISISNSSTNCCSIQ